MQYRRKAVGNDRDTFLSGHINDLFAPGDGRERLIDDADGLQRVGDRCNWPGPPQNDPTTPGISL